MKKAARVIGIILLVVLLIGLIGPFLVPVPPLEGTQPESALALPGSRFIEVNGIRVHYQTKGSGEPVILLLHGFGASTFSWREVMDPLAQMGTVYAYDRPAFGLTSRPVQWQGENPYGVEAQAEMAVGLMDALGIERAILVGNSAGGGVAAMIAVKHPERVEALVLVDPAVGGGAPSSPILRVLYNTPQADRLGPLLVRSIQQRGEEIIRLAWHDTSKITPEIIAGYRLPLQADNWDRALWNLTKAPQPTGLRDALKQVTIPVLIVTGDDDRIVPTDQTIQLAKEMPLAKLVVFEACGHVPQEECPAAFMEAVGPFIQTLSATALRQP